MNKELCKKFTYITFYDYFVNHDSKIEDQEIRDKEIEKKIDDLNKENDQYIDLYISNLNGANHYYEGFLQEEQDYMKAWNLKRLKQKINFLKNHKKKFSKELLDQENKELRELYLFLISFVDSF